MDERRFHEWLELLIDDARYWMGGRSNRYPKSSKAIAIFDPEPYLEDDLTQGGKSAILDETKETLARRVARLETGMAWAEGPPSRTRHLIANLAVESAEAVSELRRWRIKDYRPQAHPQPECAPGQERQHLPLKWGMPRTAAAGRSRALDVGRRQAIGILFVSKLTRY